MIVADFRYFKIMLKLCNVESKLFDVANVKHKLTFTPPE